MYAVIATGGKQEKVSEGQVLEVEVLKGAAAGGSVTFRPVLVVDGAKVVSSADQLAAAKVEAKVVGEVKGTKIRGFNYKNKSRQTKRWGHRQKYTKVKITGIKG